MKNCVVPGTISESHSLGKAVREARAAGRDAAEAALAIPGGRKLFQGTLVKKDWAVKDGYLDGYHVFERRRVRGPYF